LLYRGRVFCRYQKRFMNKRLQFTTKMVCADAGFHAD
jgi:hypothetical protein